MTIKTVSSKSRIKRMRSITEIKKIIYNTLKNDATLTALVPVARIYHQFPTIKTLYPAIFYSIIADDSFPFNEDERTSNSTETVFGIDIFSNASNTAQSDSIDDRVFQLFNGKSFNNTNLLVYNCERTYYTQYFDTDSQLWRTISRYKMVSSPK